MDKDKLFQHYNDTFAQQKEYIAKRDRLTIYLLLSVVGFAFLMSNPDTLTKVVDAYVKDKFSFSGSIIDFSILNTGLIYVLLWFVLQYYQICLTIEKGYDELWDMEDRLSKDEEPISREGESYVTDYPLLKNVANFIYAWGIPIGIAILSIVRIVDEFKCGSGVWPDYIGLSIICLLSVLYFSDRNLRWSYFNRQKHNGLGRWKRLKGFVKLDVKE